MHALVPHRRALCIRCCSSEQPGVRSRVSAPRVARKGPSKAKEQHQPSPRDGRAAWEAFRTTWMPRLLQQQDEILDTSARLNSLTERVGEDFQQAQDKLAEVMEGVFASAELPDEEQNPYVRTTSPFNTAEALRRTLPTNMPIAAPEDLPQELAAIAADIQSTNQALRRLEGNFKDVSFSLGVLQEGAEARDAQTEAYREALLQLADDMEAQEAEQRALEEMLAVRAAEKRAQEEARREEAMRRELDELVAAASAAQAAQASAAVAETIEATVAQAAAELPPVKLLVAVRRQTKPGQTVVLVGSHPLLGSWSLDAALPLTWTEGHVWRASVELPADVLDLQYKAVLCSSSGKPPLWQGGDNHTVSFVGQAEQSVEHAFD